MVKNRKEVRINLTSSLLVALIVVMIYTTVLSSTFSIFQVIEFGVSNNSVIRLASATSEGEVDGDDEGGEHGGSSDTESTGDEDTESTGDEDAESTGDEDAESTGDEDAESTGDEDTESTGDEDTESTGDEDAESTGDEDAEGKLNQALCKEQGAFFDPATGECTNIEIESTGDEVAEPTGDEVAEGKLNQALCKELGAFFDPATGKCTNIEIDRNTTGTPPTTEGGTLPPPTGGGTTTLPNTETTPPAFDVKETCKNATGLHKQILGCYLIEGQQGPSTGGNTTPTGRVGSTGAEIITLPPDGKCPPGFEHHAIDKCLRQLSSNTIPFQLPSNTIPFQLPSNASSLPAQQGAPTTVQSRIKAGFEGPPVEGTTSSSFGLKLDLEDPRVAGTTPPTGGNTTKSPTGGNTTKSPTGGNTTKSPTGGNTTTSPTSPASQTRVKVINNYIYEGREPIGSSFSSSSSSSSSSSAVNSGGTPTAKPFPEFNNPANAAARLVIMNSTITKNQLTSGSQVDITGNIQNIRPASTTTPTDPNNINDIINTAAMINVEATFFDKANNVIEVKNIAAEPNRLGPGESGIFHIVVNDPTSSNIAKATYLAQWVGIDSSGSQMLLHPTAEELQAAAATAISPTTTTATPDAAGSNTSPDTSQ